jgi:uncharacterized coiled-coil DUF342 family protein
MKNFQRNLFIVLAIALCGTCAYQWYLQAVQLQTIEKLNQDIYDKSAKIQDYTNSIKRTDEEVNQLQERVTQIKKTAMSNDQVIISERREVARLLSASDLLTNEIIQYKAVVDTLTNKLQQAFEGEKQLAQQRDEFVKKLNDSITARNGLTSNYNTLVGRFNQLQSNYSAAAAAAAAAAK